MSNTPEVKTYTWDQLTIEPGLYVPFTRQQQEWKLLVLDNKYDDNDDGWAMRGDFKPPEVVLLYHSELKIFLNLPVIHGYYNETFIKVPETIIIR